MTHKKLSARILSIALSAAMVFTMLPATVFAAEGDTPLGVSNIHTITAFEELGEGYIKSVPFDGHTYAVTVKRGTPIEEIKLPTELGVTVEKTTTTTTPPAKDDVVDSSEAPKDTAPTDTVTTDEPAAPVADTDTTVSGNVPATPSDAAPAPAPENKPNAEAPPVDEPEQDKETTVTETTQETIPVTWKGDREYTPDQNSKVIYTAELPEGYALKDGTALPTIYVMVGRQARGTGTVIEVDGTTKTLAVAISEAKKGDTLKLTNSIDLSDGNVSFTSNDITIDLNGKTITSSISASGQGTIMPTSNSTLTICDSSEGAKGKVANTGKGDAINADYSTVKVTSGTVETDTGIAISCRGGKILISQEDATKPTLITSKNVRPARFQSSGIINASYGSLIITGGTISNTATGDAMAVSVNRPVETTISGASTKITSAHSADNGGTIYMFMFDTTPAAINIQDATVENTASPEGFSVHFDEYSNVTGSNISSYCIVSESARVGKIYPEPNAITFDARNGDTIADVKVGADMTLPADPTWTGYVFDGWYSGIDGTDAAASPAFTGKLDLNTAKALTASATVYAKWTKGGNTVRTETLDFDVETPPTNPGDQGWTWASDTKTLTLDGVNIQAQKNEKGIQLPRGESVITLTEGSVNNVKAGSFDFKEYETSIGVSGSVAYDPLEINGKGTLNATGGDLTEIPSYGIYCNGLLTIDGATVNATGGKLSVTSEPGKYSSDGLHVSGFDIKNNANVTATSADNANGSPSYGIKTSSQKCTITDSTLTATAGTVTGDVSSVGIYIPSWGDGMTVTNSTVTAKGHTAAISMDNGTITAAGATVTGATEEFVSGATKKLTQPDPNIPVVISFVPKITFDACNGATIADVEVGADMTLPAAPTWDGYVFDGWYDGIDGTDAAGGLEGKLDLTKAKALSASTTVYAKWTAPNGKTVRTTTLDLTGSITPAPNQGWTWNAETKTLAIDGFILSTADYVGIKLPDGATITASGTNKINFKNSCSTTDATNIMGLGALNIKGAGTIDVYNEYATSGKYIDQSVRPTAYGIKSVGALAIDGVTLNVEVQIRKNGEPNHQESAAGVSSGSTVTIGAKSPANVTILLGGFTYTANGLFNDSGKITMKAGNLSIDSTGAALCGDVVLEGGITTLKGADYAYKGGDGETLIAEGGVITGSETIDGTQEPAKVALDTYNNVIVLVSDETKQVKHAVIKFNPSYTGVEAAAPNKIPAAKTETSITLAAVTVAGETVEYGYSKASNGTITWQDVTGFTELTAGTKYFFFARVKANDKHKAGAKSTSTAITTKYIPATVSGTVKDATGTATSGAIVTLRPSDPLLTCTTGVDGTYSFSNVPEGVYNLEVKTGTEPTITITDIVTVTGTGTDITGKEMQFLEGNKNTVVESTPDTGVVAVGGMNDLLDAVHLNTTLNTTEQAITANGGSVELKFIADEKTANEVGNDKRAIEGIASGKTIDKLLDLSVLKTVKSATGGAITTDEKIATLADIIVVQIPIPASLQDKEELALYRVHNGVAEALAKGVADTNGEYYTISEDGTYVTLHVKNFSTYAFGYTAATTPPAPPTGGGGGGGSATTNDTNTVNKPENGTFTINPSSPSKGQTVTITTKPDAGYAVDQVIVKDADGKKITVTVKGTDAYTFVQPAGKVTVEVTYKKAGTGDNGTFTDVEASDWFYEAVMTATTKGWFNGTSETTFNPNAPTSRGMIATILHRMSSTPDGAAASFADVAAKAYYAKGVAWAEANSIVRGYENGNYGPNDNITREQLAAILYRYAGYKKYDVSKTATLKSFKDGETVSGYAKEAMNWAVGSGLISGRGNSTLAPKATATRAEVATILVGFEKLFIK